MPRRSLLGVRTLLPDYISIRIGDYHGNICLSALHELPLSNFRKVLRLMADPCNECRSDISVLEQYLQEATSAAEDRYQEAKANFIAGYKDVPNRRSRKPEVKEILRRNKELMEAKQAAYHRYDALKQRLDIFKERMI